MMHSALTDTHVVPKRELLRGTLIAAVVAAGLLTVAVLPAEYGIDVTGLGKAMGLTKLHAAPEAPVVQTTSPGVPALKIPATPGSTVSAPGEERALTISSSPSLPYRADDMEVTLAPGKGVEVKTHLAKGSTLIYAWKTKNAEKVNHDFHGEPESPRVF